MAVPSSSSRVLLPIRLSLLEGVVVVLWAPVGHQERLVRQPLPVRMLVGRVPVRAERAGKGVVRANLMTKTVLEVPDGCRMVMIRPPLTLETGLDTAVTRILCLPEEQVTAPSPPMLETTVEDMEGVVAGVTRGVVAAVATLGVVAEAMALQATEVVVDLSLSQRQTAKPPRASHLPSRLPPGTVLSQSPRPDRSLRRCRAVAVAQSLLFSISLSAHSRSPSTLVSGRSSLLCAVTF